MSEFNPDAENASTSRWVKIIDMLGNVHGWAEDDRVLIFQEKLAGDAMAWFRRLDNIDRS